MRYSKKIEKEINLLASLIYCKLDEEGHWRMKMFSTKELLEVFPIKSNIFYRQLGYLKQHGYIEYVSPKENRAGKIKTLVPVEFDGEVDHETLSNMDKFKPNKLKIISALKTLDECTTNDVKYYLDDTPRATISRILLSLEREGIVESLVETHKGSNIENKWRLA
ncbi:hypothetical protein PSYJYH_000018 [Bacillus phage PSYJ-YH]|nr:hypothetical protein PSYJYH_000018 [Bacillus phage PSYJ-YH]